MTCTRKEGKQSIPRAHEEKFPHVRIYESKSLRPVNIRALLPFDFIDFAILPAQGLLAGNIFIVDVM